MGRLAPSLFKDPATGKIIKVVPSEVQKDLKKTKNSRKGEMAAKKKGRPTTKGTVEDRVEPVMQKENPAKKRGRADEKGIGQDGKTDDDVTLEFLSRRVKLEHANDEESVDLCFPVERNLRHIPVRMSIADNEGGKEIRQETCRVGNCKRKPIYMCLGCNVPMCCDAPPKNPRADGSNGLGCFFIVHNITVDRTNGTPFLRPDGSKAPSSKKRTKRVDRGEILPKIPTIVDLADDDDE
jgi:hypothetical protein